MKKEVWIFFLIIIVFALKISDSAKTELPENIIRPYFILSDNSIEIVMHPEEAKKREIKITNTGSKTLNINVTLDSISRFVGINETDFNISSQNSKTILLNFYSGEAIPGAYNGKIILTSQETSKTIDIIIIIQEKKLEINLEAKIVDKVIDKEQETEGVLFIKNLARPQKFNVSLYYSIENFKGEIISFNRENFILYNEKTITKKIKIGRNHEEGQYIFFARASYENESIISSDIFEVKSTEIAANIDKNQAYKIMLLFAIIFIIIFLIARYKKLHKMISQ